MKPEITCRNYLQKALCDKVLPAYTSQERPKQVRQGTSHPPASAAGHQGITSNVHKSWQEYQQLKWGQRYCFWLTAISGPLKDEIQSFQQGNSMLWRRTSPQNYWIWPARNLPSTSKLYLQVPNVEVSNWRSLCLKTRKRSQIVIELLSVSLPSGKGTWKKSDRSQKISK